MGHSLSRLKRVLIFQGIIPRGASYYITSSRLYIAASFSKLDTSAPFLISIICARQFPKTNLLKRRKSKGIIFWNLTSPRETGRSKTPKPVLVKRRKPQNSASRKLVAAQVSNSKELRNPRASSQPLGQLLLSESGGNGQIIVQYFADITLRRVFTTLFTVLWLDCKV